MLVTAPSADDLAAAPEGSNLDLPGDAGDPGCDFEQRFGRRTSTLPVTQYVRLGVDDERPGRFAVQYWWWYVYNDWNDLHEGDWEMSQIVFDAATPEDALAQDLAPSKMALSQHFGTEVHDWADVAREGDRPLVYRRGRLARRVLLGTPLVRHQRRRRLRLRRHAWTVGPRRPAGRRDARRRRRRATGSAGWGSRVAGASASRR